MRGPDTDTRVATGQKQAKNGLKWPHSVFLPVNAQKMINFFHFLCCGSTITRVTQIDMGRTPFTRIFQPFFVICCHFLSFFCHLQAFASICHLQALLSHFLSFFVIFLSFASICKHLQAFASVRIVCKLVKTVRFVFLSNAWVRA